MQNPEPIPNRASPRTTALGALAIFLPLFALLLWWAYAYRVGPLTDGRSAPMDGTLRGAAAVIAAALAAGGPSVGLALLLANRRRLRAMLRVRPKRIFTSLVLALITPIGVLNWFPVILGAFAVSIVDDPWFFWRFFPAGIALATLAWYPVVSLIASGVRSHCLRFAVFALAWWSIYGTALLNLGNQTAY